MIEFTRGDSFFFKFYRRYPTGDRIMTKSEKMWFTIKDNYNSKRTLIQKTLNDGIVFTEDGYYHVTIKPLDTKKLKYKKYVYDVQVENAGLVNTIKKDKVKITEEATDEGGEE